MSQQRLWPFRRVAVDNMIRGVTRVWWELEPTFNDPGPYVFQLQYGNTPLRDTPDWHNVGTPVTDGYVAYDDVWRNAASDLLTHYRVTLTTAKDIYVSQVINCFGEWAERDWVLAREVARREMLRHKFTSVQGYLLKPYRFGRPCNKCRDPLSAEITNSNCPICNGTGFEVGYHPPLPLQCWDLSLQTISEHQDPELKGTTRENAEVTARALGFPTLNRNDIWVNGKSDERWLIHEIRVAAAMRGIPVVYEVSMGLLPFNNPAYAIEIGGEPWERPGPVLPRQGCGSILIDHNFGGPDNLAYRDGTGYAVVDAAVYVFLKSVADAAYPDYPDRAQAVAVTTTRANGRWTEALMLDPGEYTLLFEKPGEYGPDTHAIVVLPEDATSSCAWITDMELGEGSSESIAAENNEPLVNDSPVNVCGPVPEQKPYDNFFDF